MLYRCLRDDTDIAVTVGAKLSAAVDPCCFPKNIYFQIGRTSSLSSSSIEAVPYSLMRLYYHCVFAKTESERKDTERISCSRYP